MRRPGSFSSPAPSDTLPKGLRFVWLDTILLDPYHLGDAVRCMASRPCFLKCLGWGCRKKVAGEVRKMGEEKRMKER
ncbi:MAG: hypothetical protein QW756_02130, partial [Nitrososphaerota archaeon]